MPIPTPEPLVKRYGRWRGDECTPDPNGTWCLWSDVEALLTAQAQEIERLKAELHEAKALYEANHG